MKVVPVPVLDDNYAYLVIDEKTNVAVAIDPADASKVLQAATDERVHISAILVSTYLISDQQQTTHHHWDHSSGNKALQSALKETSKEKIAIYGVDERVEGLTHKLEDGDTFSIQNLSIKVHHTPCHTTGHALYEITEGNATPSLFTGDTLFIGCGRFFEGTPAQMHHALNTVIASLDPQTKVYCGHEYTLKNLQFAKTIEPENKDLLSKLEWVENQRKANRPTIPSTIEEEKKFNPFLRVGEMTVAKAVGLPTGSPVEVMAALRKRKDAF